MHLERLELVPYALTFRRPYVTSRGELRRRDLLLVRLHAEGAVGLGEAAPLMLRGGPDLAALATELEDVCWPALDRTDVAPGRIWAALARCRNRGVSAQALAALDIALHDVAARLAGVPLWRLLGAERAAPVHCNATLPAANPTTLIGLAEEWAADGFTTFKLKVGLAGDVRQVGAVREALGAGARIRVDANGAWHTEEAIEQLRAMARHNLELVEQPANGLEQLAEVRRRTGLTVAADESVVTPRDARRAVALDACDLATVKLAKCGGTSPVLAIAAEIPVYLSSALDGPVGIAAAAHAVQALPGRSGPNGLAHGLATGRLFEGTIASRQPELRGDTIELGDEPGLGIEIDERALEAAALESI